MERAIAKQEISVELKSSMDSKKGSKRTLSPNICTRTHRAPEVIAADNFYNEKLDIWSLGIVLAEVMLQVQSNLNKQDITPEERLLFLGRYCYPISPNS